jgi:hypothetical protein
VSRRGERRRKAAWLDIYRLNNRMHGFCEDFLENSKDQRQQVFGNSKARAVNQGVLKLVPRCSSSERTV